MSRRSRSVVAGLGAALLLVGALAGCATPSGGASASASAGPPLEPAPEAQTVPVLAAWLDGGGAIAVVLEGSSTCVPTAGDATYADGVLNVSMIEPAEDAACTRDLVPRGIPVAVPAGVDTAQDLTVAVRGDGYEGQVQLAGVAGMTPGGPEDPAPSAGWATPDTFALLTYGSSSCVPQVAETAISAPGEIAVTFATPPEDQMCTADFAPRVTLVWVADPELGASYEAVLTGDGFDDTRVAIVGSPG